MTNRRTHRLANALKADLLFSFKHGFYYVYLILMLLYIVLLGLFDDHIVKTILPIILYTDPSALGLFFIGSMIMLEKQQGILALLHITPIRVREYIWAKIISLYLVSLLTSIAIVLFGSKLPVNHIWLLLGISLTSVFFTLIGFLISMNAKSVNDYLVKMIPWMLLLVLPCFSLIPNGLMPQAVNWIIGLIPSVAGLRLVFAAVTPEPVLQLLLCTASLVIANVLLMIKSEQIFIKKVFSAA